MRYEWDEDKNEENIRKHGFDFADAPEIFDSPMLVWLDSREDFGEERWIGLGNLQGFVVVVVFTERDHGETIRIISLRKGQKHEHQKYFQTLSN